MDDLCTLTRPLPRLVRFTDGAINSGGERIVAQLDKEQNILLVDRALYDTLTPFQQDRVIKTNETVVADLLS